MTLNLPLAASHMVMWAMSDRGIPRSFRMMQGFGVNTYTLVNAKGERFFVKFHWLPELGVHSLMWDEALKIGGQDPGEHCIHVHSIYYLQTRLDADRLPSQGPPGSD